MSRQSVIVVVPLLQMAPQSLVPVLLRIWPPLIVTVPPGAAEVPVPLLTQIAPAQRPVLFCMVPLFMMNVPLNTEMGLSATAPLAVVCFSIVPPSIVNFASAPYTHTAAPPVSHPFPFALLPLRVPLVMVASPLIYSAPPQVAAAVDVL